MIAPTRLDFDASRAPKKCNDFESFDSTVSAWVPGTVWRDDAERRLVVRIRWSSTGGKRADVELVNAEGITLAERHQDFPASMECHKVLWLAAFDAAQLVGAFEPPPPKEPVTCPAPPPCPSCPPTHSCPRYAPPMLPTPTPAPHRSFIGIGAFVGSGIHSRLGFGPHLLLGFIPSSRLPALHVEFEAAWTSQASESIRMHSIPLVGSLCLVQGILRFCGGLATVMVYSNPTVANETLNILFSGNFRVGTEFPVRGPFSIRADVFGRLAFAQRRFGKTPVALDEPTPFAAGLAVMGAWAFN